MSEELTPIKFNPQGRPSKWDPQVAIDICIEIATSKKGLHIICDSNKDYPHVATIFRWLSDKTKVIMVDYGEGTITEPFCEMYTRAKQLQAEYLKDMMLTAAWDDSQDTDELETKNGIIKVENKEWTSRSKLKVDTLKFIAAKLAPRVYGDSLKLTGDKDNPIEQVVTVSFKKRKPNAE